MSSGPTTLHATEVASGLIFGESPRWRDGILYVSDMLGLQLLAIDSEGNKRVIADLPQKPNGMGFLPNGELVISSMHDARLYRVTEAGLILHADLRPLVTGYMGDMVIDATGRIYVDDVGSRVFEGDEMRPGRIIAVEPNGNAVVAAEDLAFPNGIVITNDQKTLIVGETFKGCLTAFDIADGGKLTNRRMHRDLNTLRTSMESGADKLAVGAVDGIAIDAEDGLWISLIRANEFIRMDAGGIVTHRIPLPGQHCVACTLGGDDGLTLFLVATSVAEGANLFEEMINRRTRSRILTTRVDVPRGAGRP